jgi:hypothetical protein
MEYLALFGIKSTKIVVMKTGVLALMGGKILLCRGSAQKIGRTAGIAPNKNNS